MTQEQRLVALATAVGLDIKKLLANDGSLTALSTTAKTSLVAAINEIFTMASNGAVLISDASTSGANKTYSIDKILALLSSLRSDILGGVPATAFDTLKEIADYLTTDQTATSGLLTAMGFRVSVDSAQNFNATQQAQGRANIGALSVVEIGNPDTDFTTAYAAAKA